MNNRIRKLRAYALEVESLECRHLMAGVIAPLSHALVTDYSNSEWTPSDDVTYAHEVFQLNGAGQTIVVIDSGIAYDHYALGGGLGADHRVVGGWDFTENDADPYDDGPLGYHGTHIAGVIGSSDPDVPGVAPGADLVALRVFDDSGRGDFDWIESALAWVHSHQDDFKHPITTVNLSIGSGENSEIVPDWTQLEDELETLASDGIFVAVAAGNGFRTYGVAGLNYPAASPFVIPVSSVNDAGQLSEFSQRHERALAAPGELVNSTVPDYLYGFDGITDDFARVSGTSMATPFVAGASVLVREAFEQSGLESATPDEIYQHLMSTADVVFDETTDSNYRRLNLRAAIDAILKVPPQEQDEESPSIVPPNSALPPDAISLGTVEQASLFPSFHQGDWFSFTPRHSGVMTVVGSVGELAGATIRNREGLIDTLTQTGTKEDQWYMNVEQGREYFLQLPSANGHIRLAQIVAIDSGRIDVRGDRNDSDVFVQVGMGRAVAARRIRESVSVDSRQTTSPQQLEIETSPRGLIVRMGTRLNYGVATTRRGRASASPLGLLSPLQDEETRNRVLSPLHGESIYVGVQRKTDGRATVLSLQATDATFSDASEEGNARPLPAQLVDRMYSHMWTLDAPESIMIGPIADEISGSDEEAIDRILSDMLGSDFV